MRLTRPILLALLLAGCPKPTTLQAPAPVPVRVGSVLESATEGPVEADTTALDAIVAEIEARNLTPVAVEVSGPHRKRLEMLAQGASGGVILLVESTARYSTQMNGRYRWTVEVEAKLADPEALDEAAVESFTVPVHLLYAHERENDALIAATPSIARRVGALLDDWIRAQGQ
ncbi:MAG: hypothetical protein H6737_18490 [Alphaproteobacteria bacterium]|nr:hypothetical protein [Alphaproteobacteria bacterium]